MFVTVTSSRTVDAGAKQEVQKRDGRDPVAATTKNARDFIWRHWQAKKRGYIRITFNSVDATSASHIFIEPDARGVSQGTWKIVRHNDMESSPKGNRHMRRILNQAANAAAKSKGTIFEIVYRRLVSFRHSLATVLITEEQVDPKTAQGILRHANSDVTMEIYTHAQDEAKRKALEKFEARLVQ